MPEFTFDGRRVPFEAGDTLGSALHRAGVKVIGRSLKYHRPRGLYCCTGSCASCLVDVDGEPNVPACMRACQAGATVTSQNRLGSAKHDLYGITDKVFPRGFDPHGMMTKPRLLNEAFLKVVRHMSGLGKAPAPTPAPSGHLAGAPGGATGPSASQGSPRRRSLQVDELIVGGGREGLRRAQLADARMVTLIVDELDALGGSARWDKLETQTRELAAHVQSGAQRGVTAWVGSVVFGLYADPEHPSQLVAGIMRPNPAPGAPDLFEVRARRITLATGRHDAWPVFANNDLPGVLSLRGAQRLLVEHGVLPGRRIVGHGGRLPKSFVALAEARGADIVAQGIVSEAFGGTEVTGCEVNDGKHVGRVDCDAVVCVLAGTPRVELFQQAGCELAFDRSGVLAPVLDADGATTRAGVFGAFGPAPDAPLVDILPKVPA